MKPPPVRSGDGNAFCKHLASPKTSPWIGEPYSLTQALTFDTENKASILSCIIAARENARQVREQISTEQWHRLNSLYLQVTRPDTQIERRVEDFAKGTASPGDFLQSVMEAVHQFQGVTDSTMNHGEGWQFIQVGRYIERASATALLLEAYHADLWEHPERIGEGYEYLDWMGLLRSATAFEAYCKVYTADLTPKHIFEFLLLNEEFPHSVRFSIDSVGNALDKIQGDSGKSRAMSLQRLSGRLKASLSYSGVDEVLNQDVVSYLESIQAQCRAIHTNIYELYVDYSIQTALAG